MKGKMTAIFAGTMLTVIISPFTQQLSAFAANSNVVTQGKVTCRDINALRKNSNNFAVCFDSAYAEKINYLRKHNSQIFARYKRRGRGA